MKQFARQRLEKADESVAAARLLEDIDEVDFWQPNPWGGRDQFRDDRDPPTERSPTPRLR